MGHEERDEREMQENLQQQLSELEADIDARLQGGANPNDNKELRQKIIEAESLRGMLGSEGDDE